MVRVDTVPFLLRPLFLIYGWGFGVLLFVYTLFIHATCRIRFEGTVLKTLPNYILCIWHDSLVSYFTVFTNQSNQAWMNHPAWYMKPIHVLLYCSGVKDICLGSSGNSGQEALNGVLKYLKEGYSTTVASDGPAGPNHELKKGVLVMSTETGAPVVAVRFKHSTFFRLGNWDRKFVPLPFSEIVVQCSEPVFVNKENAEISKAKIVDWLNFSNT